MDLQLNQLARELTEAISAAVGDDARVEACREKARAAGFDMRVTLEAVIGFVDRDASPQKGSRRPPAASRRDERQRSALPQVAAHLGRRANRKEVE
jgi:hypothetical protein